MERNPTLEVVEGQGVEFALPTDLHTEIRTVKPAGLPAVRVVPTLKAIEFLPLPTASFYRMLKEEGIPTIKMPAETGSVIPVEPLAIWYAKYRGERGTAPQMSMLDLVLHHGNVLARDPQSVPSATFLDTLGKVLAKQEREDKA